ncbi:hypothetical protein X975_20762, partial [Stegodyphus mimosarum]
DESSKSSLKSEHKKDALYCEICSSSAVKVQEDNNLLQCKCGNICVTDSDGKSKVAVGVLEASAANVKPGKMDVAMASYLDVAVLRCLFISQWLEE